MFPSRNKRVRGLVSIGNKLVTNLLEAPPVGLITIRRDLIQEYILGSTRATNALKES